MQAKPASLTHTERTWWYRGRPYSRLEILSDATVHAIGLVVTLIAGGALLIVSGSHTAPSQIPANIVYIGSLLAVLSISMAYNMVPATPLKRLLARFDQAAIFLLIAGTYTPLLSLLAGSPTGDLMLIAVWGAALIGIALKLIVPQHFGRLALVLYVGIGWSGVLVFQSLANALPASTLWLLLAGGVAYSSGIVFHLWERMRFHITIWHCFVVLGASLHLWAVLDCMVLKRL